MFEVLDYLSSATFQELFAGRPGSSGNQTFSFSLCRDNGLTKQRNARTLRRPGFEGIAPVAFREANNFGLFAGR